MRVLSIDGGGYLGLATASFIEGIEDHFGVRLAEHFDLFCGTSTGAIIALALASGKSGTDIVKLYRQLGTQVFGEWSPLRSKWQTARSLFTAKYSNAGLIKALGDTFAEMTLDDLSKAGKHALITSFCVSTGRPRLFKTDHSENLSLHGQYRLQDIALASAAAPIFFPMVKLIHPKNGVVEAFCDGGVVANHPAALGFAEAISELKAAPKDVTLLSLSTPRSNLADPKATQRRLTRGVLGWALPLSSIFIDSNSMISEQCLLRTVKGFGVGGPRYERVILANDHDLPMDRADAYATETLLRTGASEAASNVVRAKVAPLLGVLQSN